MKGRSFPIDFFDPALCSVPDAPALPDEIKDVALTVSARLDQDGVAATRGPTTSSGASTRRRRRRPRRSTPKPRGVVSKTMK